MQLPHDTITVQVNALIQDPVQGTTAVLLTSKETESLLPIWIGMPEAVAISQALNGKPTERPLTHQLIDNTIRSLDGQLTKVEITRIHNETFFAVLHVKVGTQCVLIDARPSDAIAVAIYAKRPIIVAPDVWEEASISLSQLGFTIQPRKLRSMSELKVKLQKIRERESHTKN